MCTFSNLSMNLRSLPILVQEVVVHSIQMSFLFVGCPVAVLVSVLGNFSFRILAIWKQARDRDSWRHSLRFATTGPSFLLLRFPLFLLFCSCTLLPICLNDILERVYLRKLLLPCSHHPHLCLRPSRRSQPLQRLD